VGGPMFAFLLKVPFRCTIPAEVTREPTLANSARTLSPRAAP
jgi:hypothetical protein